MPGPEWNFDWVREDLAVGGGFVAGSIARLVSEHEVGAVIDLREEDRDDEARLTRAGVRFLHLPTPDMLAVSITALNEAVAFARDVRAAGRRLLIHCQHGIGRSAMTALCVMVDRGEDPLNALKALKKARAITSPSAAQYEGWTHWLAARGYAAPDFETFAGVAYATAGVTAE